MPLARRDVLLDDVGAEDVGRHQVGRELNAVELQVDRVGERLDEQRLGQAGHAAQQAMAAGEQADEDFAPHLLLADDDAADFVVQAADQRRRFVERRGSGAMTGSRHGRHVGVSSQRGLV